MRSLLLLLVACGSSTESGPEGPGPGATGQTPEPQSPTITITSPQGNASFPLGEAFTLDARVVDASGQPRPDAAIEWYSEGGWAAQGAPVTVGDLPEGTHTITAVGYVDGLSDDATVRVTIEAPEIPPEPVSYTGTLAMQTVLDAGSFGTFEQPCVHDALDFELDGATFTGEGACTVDVAFFTQQFIFAVEGTVTGGAISGSLTSAEAGGEPLPFSGTYDEASGQMDATYDQTYDGEQGSLRLFGSFSASPL